MTEQNGSNGPAPETPQSGPRRSRRRWIIAGSIVGSLALLAGAWTAVEAHGGGWHHDGRMSADAFSEHIEHHVKSVLSEVDATPEQEAQVTSILQGAARDVYALKDQHVSAHKQLHEILSAETIDRARLETVCADQIRLADEASQRFVSGLADAAEVLTPEQRAAFVARMERHHDWQEP
jgi:Spy/CpxP family protein refolding chaperone